MTSRFCAQSPHNAAMAATTMLFMTKIPDWKTKFLLNCLLNGLIRGGFVGFRCSNSHFLEELLLAAAKNPRPEAPGFRWEETWRRNSLPNRLTHFFDNPFAAMLHFNLLTLYSWMNWCVMNGFYRFNGEVNRCCLVAEVEVTWRYAKSVSLSRCSEKSSCNS